MCRRIGKWPGGRQLAISCLSLLVTVPTGQAQSVCSACPSAIEAADESEAAPPPTLDLRATYALDIISNASGGIATGTDVLGDLSVTLSIRTQRLLGIADGTFFIYSLLNHGGDPSERIGDAQVADNIEAPDTWTLYELWYQQNLMGQQASLLVGLYDLNSEFDVIESAGLFLNSSFGIGAEYGSSGRNGPSIFPVTSLGVRLAARPTRALSGKLAVLDGVPGDPSDPHGMHIELGGGDGALVAGEITVWLDGREVEPTHQPRVGRGRQRPPYLGKLALGAWHYTGDFVDSTAPDERTGATREGSYGVYGLVEYEVTGEATERGLTLFARLGWADPRVNRVAGYTGAGLVYHGLLPGRGTDRLGLGLAVAHSSRRFQRARERAGTPVDDAELAIEFTYAAELSTWLSLQPDVQYIINPGMEPGRPNALVLGVRLQASH